VHRARNVVVRLGLLALLLGSAAGVGMTPGCGDDGYHDDCYCEWNYDPFCDCYVETCYHCKSVPEKRLALPEPPEPGFRVEVRDGLIVAVREEGW
jgi:hypothetical protein